MFPFIALKTWYHRPGGLTHMFDSTLPEPCLISQSYLSSFPLVQYVTNLVEVVTFFFVIPLRHKNNNTLLKNNLLSRGDKAEGIEMKLLFPFLFEKKKRE